jgi:hypothetical protein
VNHKQILSEIPRILRELRLPQQARKPWEAPGALPLRGDGIWTPPIEEIHAADDVIYRLCCDESLEMLAKEFACSRERVYAALVKIFKRSYPPAVPYGYREMKGKS